MPIVRTEEPEWAQVTALGREMVRIVRPGELEFFDEVAAEVRSDQGRVQAAPALRPPVGFGIDLALLTPYVLALASWVFATASEHAVEVGEEAIGAGTRQALGRLLGRAPAMTQEPAIEPAAPAPPECLRPASALRCLLSAQEREVHDVVAVRAERDGQSATQAQELAEAVVGALRLRSGCCR